MYRVHTNALLVGQLRAPWTHKPLSGLVRTQSGSQKVLRRCVRGFPCTGCTETLSKLGMTWYDAGCPAHMLEAEVSCLSLAPHLLALVTRDSHLSCPCSIYVACSKQITLVTCPLAPFILLDVMRFFSCMSWTTDIDNLWREFRFGSMQACQQRLPWRIQTQRSHDWFYDAYGYGIQDVTMSVLASSCREEEECGARSVKALVRPVLRDSSKGFEANDLGP